MLPGPFRVPPFPGLPSYIPPVILWLLLLGAAVAIVITLFRFLVAESSERTNAFLIFLLVLVVVMLVYLGLMNGLEIAAWFQRTFKSIFGR